MFENFRSIKNAYLSNKGNKINKVRQIRNKATYFHDDCRIFVGANKFLIYMVSILRNVKIFIRKNGKNAC